MFEKVSLLLLDTPEAQWNVRKASLEFLENVLISNSDCCRKTFLCLKESFHSLQSNFIYTSVTGRIVSRSQGLTSVIQITV